MDVVQTVTPVTAPRSLPGALVLLLRLGGLVLLWWLLTTVSAPAPAPAHADTRDTGDTIDGLMHPVGRAPVARDALTAAAAATRATMDRSVDVVRAVESTSPVTVIAPVIAPIVQSAVAVVAEPHGDDDGTGGGHGTDESGGPASQPTGGPQGGTAVTTAQGLLPNPAHNGAVLPQTGLDAGLLAWSLAGLLLVAGLLLLGGPVRRTRPGR